jgi:hypothetical protein
MPILDRRSNAQPAVPGSVTGDRDTVFGQFFDQWLMNYPAAGQRVSIKVIYRHKCLAIKRVRLWRIELAQPPFCYNYLTVKLYYKKT